MEPLNEKVYLAKLFDTYQSLLTEKQQQYFSLTINEDLSLQEIATNFNVSRNAVFDSNQKTEKLLIDFENKLQILAKHDKISNLLDQYSTTKSEDVKELIEKLREVI